MKARVPINNKTKNKIKQYVLEETEKHMNEVHRAASEVFLLAAACELHLECGFGKKRLMQFMCGLQDFYELLGGYDDSAKYKCLQILGDAGIDLKSFFDNGGEHENET